mgnify:CR=1 FL=1
MKITKGGLAMIFIFGMMFGYIAGLWHQAAQKAHKNSCSACREYLETDRQPQRSGK